MSKCKNNCGCKHINVSDLPLPSAVEVERKLKLERDLEEAKNNLMRLEIEVAKKVSENYDKEVELNNVKKTLESIKNSLTGKPTTGQFMGKKVVACAEVVFIPKE